MYKNFVIILLIILVIFYLTEFIKKNEEFSSYDSNIYESIGIVPNKMLYFNPPNLSQSDIDYQHNLNEISGYDSGTRGYYNPIYAANIAASLNTN